MDTTTVSSVDLEADSEDPHPKTGSGGIPKDDRPKSRQAPLEIQSLNKAVSANQS